MSKEVQNGMSALEASLLHTADQSTIVKAEDLPQEGGGLDYKKIFFEPEIGKTYTLKLLPNPGGELITHRKVYKHLPDPKRKGKNFHYVSSGSAKTCKVLDLFFELHKMKKEQNDPLAIQKLDKYMGVTNQAVVLVQILSAPEPELIGQFRLFTYSTYGPNPEIATMLDKKLNPSKEMIAEGFEKEDLFNIFESPVLILKCEETLYEGNKGRGYGKSDWAPKRRGAFVNIPQENDTFVKYEFTKSDFVDGVLNEKAKPAFQQLITELTNPEISIHKYFAYKDIENPKNDEDTKKYLVEVNAKVDEIVPIIRNAKSINEVASYGVADTTQTDSAKTIGGQKASDILKDSIPNELAGSIMNDVASTPASNETKPDVSALASSNPSIDDIMNS